MKFGYDVIGDIHAQLEPLERLLEKMGYSRTSGGVWGHPDRMAIFVGDLVDRGPEQLGTIDLVRRMMSAGTAFAVMGNHELNAIAFATEDGKGEHLRRRTEKNRAQHAAFLREVGEDSAAHREAVGFFKTLPFFFEISGLRVVHACWHQASVDAVRPHLDRQGLLPEELWPAALRKETALGLAVDVSLKGPELVLPQGRSFVDKDGHERSALRVKWWDPEATTYRRAGISVPGDDVGELPDVPLDEDFRYGGDRPVLFGHYWMTGDPSLTGAHAACVDFSVARPEGHLAAYRWSGERILVPDNMVAVPALEPALGPTR